MRSNSDQLDFHAALTESQRQLFEDAGFSHSAIDVIDSIVPDRVYTIGELASILRVHRSTIRYWMIVRGLPRWAPSGANRVLGSDYITWLATIERNRAARFENPDLYRPKK